MHTTLYMAISANGFIAKSDDDTNWISEAEWNSYSQAVQNAGCMIIGHRTYEILTKQPEFSEFKDIKIVIVSSQNFQTLSALHLIAHSSREALDLLADFSEVIIAGGGILNSSFIAENLVDEIFLDVEPIILGEGIPLFSESQFQCSLKLLEYKLISKNEIQLHYEVVKT